VADNSYSGRSGNFQLRPFLGISGDFAMIKGDYDGTSYFALENNEFVLVPKLTPGPGLGLRFGLKFRRGEVDWAYNLVSMKYECINDGLSGTSLSHFIRLFGYKGYIGDEKKIVKPFIYFDWSIAMTRFSNVSFVGESPVNTKPVTYTGMTLSLGAGLQANAGRNLSFDAMILPGYYMGTDIKTKGEHDTPIKKFGNFILWGSVVVNYYFK
jgi:hypothetical protein